MAEQVQQKQPQRKLRCRMIGVVTSAHKTPKSLRVDVTYQVRHRRYSKYMRRRHVLHVHDEQQEAREGDRVEVMECRKISKTKTWRLVRVIERRP
jgi:small subunit ribosomal protein S17